MSDTAFDQAQAARAVLLDWDGCVVENGALKPGSRDFLRAFGDKVSILSNNSTDLPAKMAAMLARAGAPIPENRIHLAGHVALQETVRRCGDYPVYLLANNLMTRAAQRLGINAAPSDRPVAVVLLRDTNFTFRKLERAVQLLRTGAVFVIANPDLTHPKASEVAPETGALLAAITACVDLAGVDTTVVGKPSAMLFERALATAGVSAGEALMMGDNPTTDVEGARRLGIASVLLGPQSDVTLESIMRSPDQRLARRG